ncbi:MAG: bifunctional molybdenum cofactor biosynthesis protein MoaC/MoaB [Chlorobiales bacterium]|nr:bifunctional molybdenum cofactor biosynthesis protein MoaC/MoaB [Chlorobiales bacterium]
MSSFSHLDENGKAKMVDVTDKLTTVRTATAEGCVVMKPETIASIKDAALPKGDVLTTAKIAGIMAAKRTAELIPMCHPLSLTYVDIQFEIQHDRIQIKATTRVKEATGVEMEALTAVSVCALTIYDMCKAVDQSMVISEIKLTDKKGGKSSHKTDYRPKTGILVLSDSISKGVGEDKSGAILKKGFEKSGCPVTHFEIIPDEPQILEQEIDRWIEEGVELIVTSGGTGIGPRDLTIETLEKKFDRRLPGIEQALHAYGLQKVKTAMLSRLSAGLIGSTVVICIPGSPGAAKDALQVLIPTIFHSFHMQRSEKHEPSHEA